MFIIITSRRDISSTVEQPMRNLKHKLEMIQSIQDLQLHNSLIYSLNDEQQAAQLITAIACLKNITQQWH